MRLRVAMAGLGLLAAAGCGGTSDGGTTDAADGTVLTVLAAASLTETFTDLAETFEAEQSGVEVRLAFDSSATLATQVVAGAPADVLATADARTMQSAVDAGVTSAAPVEFATNTMVLVVPRDNPADVRSFADLRRPDVSYVACVESAPCGVLAESLLTANGVTSPARSLEIDVKAVLTRVVLDEADAGLVYASDAVAAGDKVRTVPIPGANDDATSYLLTTLEQAAVPGLAEEWIDLVLSERGRTILSDAGFQVPGR